MKILLTGGASGLGKAITKALAQKTTSEIYMTYHSSQEEALGLEREFPKVKAFHVDFNSNESLSEFVRVMAEIKPDVLINNAATGYSHGYFHKFDSDTFENSFKSTVYPVLRITQQFIVESRKRKSGKIITILSAALINKPPLGWSEYVANKAYLHSMAKSWAVENAPFGITSNCISPSFMKTNFTRHLDERIIENLEQENPNKALLKEEEVAEAVLFLITSTLQINGNNLIINAAKDIL